MEKTTLYLPPSLQADLRALARRAGRSQAALIREALEAYVGAHERPWPRSIGMAADGSLDASSADAWLASRWEADLLPQDEPKAGVRRSSRLPQKTAPNRRATRAIR